MDITFVFYGVSSQRPQDTPVEQEIIRVPDDTPLNRIEAVGLTRLRNGFSLDSREFARGYDSAKHRGWFVLETNADVDMGTHGIPLVEDQIIHSLAEVWGRDA